MLMIAYIEGLNNSWLTNLTWKAFVYATHPQQWYCAVYWIITTVREGVLGVDQLLCTGGRSGTAQCSCDGDIGPKSVAEQVIAITPVSLPSPSPLTSSA